MKLYFLWSLEQDTPALFVRSTSYNQDAARQLVTVKLFRLRFFIEAQPSSRDLIAKPTNALIRVKIPQNIAKGK